MTHTVATALRWAEKQLSALATPRLDAELLLAKVFAKPRSFIFAYADASLTEEQSQQYQALIELRHKKIPLAYLLSEKEFWSLVFHVTPDVLIPRPETELLIELILQDYKRQTTCTVLDLGTGSGAIAVTLAAERPSWHIWASDLSQAALDLAKQNAARLLANDVEITFIQSDWLMAFPKNILFDVIVCNPPYLAAEDPYLFNSEISHEPKSALIADDFGLADFKKIAAQAKSHLAANGRLYFEHGAEQAEAVVDILRQANFSEIKNYSDLAGLPRVICAVA